MDLSQQSKRRKKITSGSAAVGSTANRMLSLVRLRLFSDASNKRTKLNRVEATAQTQGCHFAFLDHDGEERTVVVRQLTSCNISEAKDVSFR